MNKLERKELFTRWFLWSVKFKDCDPSIWMMNYLNKRYEHNSEERFWLAYLYGTTYHVPAAWVIKSEFPDFELATNSRIKAWNDANYKRLRYQTDTKYNKGHLPEMFASYQQFIGRKTQKETFEKYFVGTPIQNFNALFKIVKGALYKFGRYSTWYYLQALKQTCGVAIEPPSLILNDYSGSRSHRNGLCKALGQDAWVDAKLNPTQISWLEGEGHEILQEVQHRMPELRNELDFFAMETALCSFKKIFREREGRYLGYYLDRQAEEIKKVEGDGWFGIDWDVLWQARKETLDPRLINNSINKKKFSEFLETGRMDKLDWL